MDREKGKMEEFWEWLVEKQELLCKKPVIPTGLGLDGEIIIDDHLNFKYRYLFNVNFNQKTNRYEVSKKDRWL